MVAGLDVFGMNATRLIAGFWGGLVYAFVFKETGPTEITGSVVVGTFTANYLSDTIAKYTDSVIGGAGTSFIVGLCAMAICRGIVAGAKSWWRVPSHMERPEHQDHQEKH